jgi:hypothetical protein
MEKRAIVLALALTLPLVLYGVPYAYASTKSSSYQVVGDQVFIDQFQTADAFANCHSGDYATGGGYISHSGIEIVQSFSPTTPPPSGWVVIGHKTTPGTLDFSAVVICQTPIQVAGIGVPEFGSLYVAIALGAVIYFALSRQHAGKRSAQATTRA